MELGSQHPLISTAAMGGRGRIAGILVPGGSQDVIMADQGVLQLPGTSTDAELEELYKALPGWHQQQSLYDSGAIFGGLARTVSAPSAFLPSASALSPGHNGPLSMAPQKEHSSVAYPCYEEVSSFQKHMPTVARWLLHERPNVSNSPLHNFKQGDDTSADGFCLPSDNRAAPAEGRLWPSRLSRWGTTMIPPGGENHSTINYSLTNNSNFDPTGTNDLNASQQLSSRQPGRAAPHNPTSGPSSSSGGGNDRRPLAHYAHLNQPQPHSHLFPSSAGTGLSDWPSGGRLIGSSTGLGLLSAASTGTGVSVLSDPPSGSYIPSRQATSCGEPLRGAPPPPSLAPMDLSVRALPSPSPPCTGPAAQPPGELLGLHAHVHARALGSGDGMAAAAAMAGGQQGTACAAVADAPKMEMIAEGAMETAADGNMQLDIEQDANCYGGGGGGGGGLQSASSGSSMCAAINGALMAAAGCDMSASADGTAAGQSAVVAAAGVGNEAGDTAAVAMAGDGADGKAIRDDGGSRTGKGITRGGTAAGRQRGINDARSARGESVTNGGGDDGLQLLAMRFRNRPGRVPKAVAKLGPIAELAKSAATGKIKLEKEELEDLVTTVETSLAQAVTEQKEDSRARNRVAQQRFRNRQRETIAALQAKVEEQEALILALQEKIRLYEAAQQNQHQNQQKQHDGGSGGGAKAQGVRATRRIPES